MCVCGYVCMWGCVCVCVFCFFVFVCFVLNLFRLPQFEQLSVLERVKHVLEALYNNQNHFDGDRKLKLSGFTQKFPSYFIFHCRLCTKPIHLDPVLRGHCTSYPKISMFCAVSQNYQHLFEKCCIHLVINYPSMPRNSKISSKSK